MNITMKMSIILVAMFSQTAMAAAISRVDAKKLMNVTEGRYAVTKSDSALDGDLVCVPKSISKVVWAGTEEHPLLLVGSMPPFREFNNGLRESSIPNDKDKCKFTHSTLAEPGRMVDDSYTNCVSQNTHTHTEAIFKEDTIEYTVKVSVSQNGKSFAAPATCTLTLIKPPAQK